MKYNCMLMAIVAVLCITNFGFAGTYSGGTGDVSDPYKITIAADWQELIDTPGDWDKHFILMNDIDFEGAVITPVAATQTPTGWLFSGTFFSGVLDGNGKVLSNFQIDLPGSNYVGLFGYIGHGGQVMNLGLENVTISGRYFVGGLAGRIEDWDELGTSISHCYVVGDIDGDLRVGGLCGENYADVSFCYAAATVTGNSENIGGLCGLNGSDSTISQCFAASAVTGEWLVGGLCGANHGTISSCYATGQVSGDGIVGGFCGENYEGLIMECYSTGLVTGVYESVGGFCGTNEEGSISWSLWDTETSGQTSSAGGFGLGTLQMQEINTYSMSGWGGTTWTMIEGQYPRLAWEQAGGSSIPEPVIPMAGDGTAGQPWLIADVNDLGLVAQFSYFWDKHFRLIDDIDLTGSGLPIIGSDPSNSFIGSFDGNGYTLSNLTIVAIESDYVGLFGAVGQGGLVKNLTLTGADVIGRDFVGALCGNNQGTIDTCSATGQVEGASYVGGLVGANGDVQSGGGIPMSMAAGKDEIKPLSGDDTRSDVSEDCIISNSSADCVVKGESYVGGLVGANGPEMWDEYPDSLSIIINCHAAGNVECGLEDYGEYAGGLCGRNSGTARDSHATGDVSGGENVGGLCGYNDWLGSIVHTYATGLVSGEFNVGGLCGRNSNAIRNSYATGNVEGSDNVGGLVGNNESGTICDSYAKNGWVTSGYYVGGLVGYNASDIVRCYADSEVEGGDYAGGLVGYNAYGSLLSSYAHGDVSGYAYIGGLIGYNDDGWVEHCYSTGTPTGTDNIGGFCGYYYTHPQWGGGADIGNFWDKESSGIATSAMGTGVMSTATMKIQATFTAAGWDFLGEDVNGTDGIWRMCADNVDYPRLRWEFSRTGDFVCDAGVELADFLHFVAYWLETDCECWYNCGWADINADGVVNLKDFSVVAENWLVTAP